MAEIIRTGVLGHAGPDGRPDLTLAQFVTAAVDGMLRAYVTFAPDGAPATFIFVGNADAHTVTGGVINAPGVRGGRGFAAAAAAVAIDKEFQNPSVERFVALVYRWNTASIRLMERIGFVAEDGAQDGDTVTYVLPRAGWPGLAYVTELLQRTPVADGRRSPQPDQVLPLG